MARARCAKCVKKSNAAAAQKKRHDPRKKSGSWK